MFFGHGLHYCLGAQPARNEGAVAIGSLVADRPGPALAADPARLTRRRSTLVRGVTAMPVSPGPRAGGGRGSEQGRGGAFADLVLGDPGGALDQAQAVGCDVDDGQVGDDAVDAGQARDRQRAALDDLG